MAREQRKLAAIWLPTLSAYSRLMGRDERGTLASLREHRRQAHERWRLGRVRQCYRCAKHCYRVSAIHAGAAMLVTAPRPPLSSV
jgi:hypothetical protein